MNEHEAKLLAIRAADGEFDPAARDRLEAYCREHPEFRAFVAEEAALAAEATALCRGLALKGNLVAGVPPAGGRRRRARGLFWAAAAAAAAVVAIVSLLAESGGEPQVRVGRVGAPAAEFEVVVGETPVALSDDAYVVRPGRYRIDARRRLLLVTPAGQVECEPGRYDVAVGGESVRVEARTGLARLENADGVAVVAAGGAGSLAAAPPVPAAPDPPPPPGEAIVSGVVTDGTGRPLEGARIWVSRGIGGVEGEVMAVSGPDGAFRAAGLGGKRYVGARAAGLAPSDLRLLDLDAVEDVRVDFRLKEKGGALRLLVVDGAGAPVPGAAVRLGSYYRNVPVRDRSNEGYPLAAARPRPAVTGADGRVTADDLPPGWCEVIVVAGDHAGYRNFVRLPPDGAVEHTVALAGAARVSGTIRDGAGAPVPGARVVYAWPYSDGKPLGEARSDAAGRYSMAVKIVGVAELRVLEGATVRAIASVRTGENEEARCDLVLGDTIDLDGVVLDDAGAPVAGARIWCRSAHRASATYHAELSTDSDGRFRFEARLPITHELWVWYPGQLRGGPHPPAARVAVRPDQAASVVVQLARRQEATSAVAGRVMLPAGAPAAESVVKLWPVGDPGWATTVVTDADGRFRIEGLRPLPYRVEVHADGHPTLHLERVSPPEGGTSDLGELRYPEAARIRLRVLQTGGRPVEKLYVSVTSRDGAIQYTFEQTGPGEGVTEGLAPGRYLVQFGAMGETHEVELAEGRDAELEIRLRRPTRVGFELVRRDGRQVQETTLEVWDAQDRRVLRLPTTPTSDGVLEIWLVPGTYRAVCAGSDGGRGEVRFDVGEQPVRTRIDLR